MDGKVSCLWWWPLQAGVSKAPLHGCFHARRSINFNLLSIWSWRMKKAGQHPWCGNFCALGEWWLESWLLVVAGHVLGEWWLESHELWVGAGTAAIFTQLGGGWTAAIFTQLCLGGGWKAMSCGWVVCWNSDSHTKLLRNLAGQLHSGSCQLWQNRAESQGTHHSQQGSANNQSKPQPHVLHDDRCL